MKFETRAIHIGEEPNFEPGGFGDAVSAIHLSSTFGRQKVDEPPQGYEYSRTKNPTRKSLEARLASLENAQFALAFASGMAAETTLILALMKANDHIIAFDDLYGGTVRLLNRLFSERYNIHTTFVDARNLTELENCINTKTKLIWLETPTNPSLRLCDIAAISKIAKKHGLLVVVDNTFMSPFFQNPLDFGADIVLHSTTKYINGHSDSVGGSIMLNNEANYNRLKFMQNAAGAILSPFDSYMVLRGIKTLAVRMKQHEENAMEISRFLEKNPAVLKVNYPGLHSHPQHDLAQKQMRGFGGMISFELNADLARTKRFVESLKFFLIAESLGGVESLIEIPALMTHASIPKPERERVGITDNLIRISVGIEHCLDLIADLENAFKNY